MIRTLLRLSAIALCLCSAPAALAAPTTSPALSVVDDTGKTVTLSQPARRVISLSPHTTEMLFAAGGGNRIVGTVTYSDYPPAARDIPRVGDNKALDLERLAALRPDLVVVWRHGNAQRQLDRLGALGIPVFYSDPRKLDQLPDTLERLGTLLDSRDAARASANAFRQRLAALRRDYAARPPVVVFYQVWEQPLMTLNGDHMISDVMAACGGRNLFAAESLLVPTISTEAVVAGNPEAIVTASMGATRSERPLVNLDHWKRWSGMTAVTRGNLFTIDGDLINRQGPRILDATAILCRQLETVRSRRPAR